MEAKAGADISFAITNFGKKGRDFCRKEGYDLVEEHLGVVGSTFDFSVASTTGKKLVDGFLGGDYDEVYVIFSEFLGMAKQVPVAQQLLPIPAIEKDEEDLDADTPYQAEHLCEPSADELLDELLPRNIYVQIFKALLETSTSEHAARMMAMDNATTACSDMIDELTLTYNRARQSAITADLMDIVGGAEALKG